MRLPIRFRLTAWYVVLLAAAVVALGAFQVVRLRAGLTADFDISLKLAAAQIRNGYQRAGRVEFQSLSSTILRVLPADSGSQLLSPNGLLESTSGVDLPRAPLVGAAQRRSVLAGHDLTLTTHGAADTEPFRVYATGVTSHSRRNLLVVASSLEGVDAASQRVVDQTLIALPALLLLSASGGWWLARRALRPVARLTEQAERMEVSRLHERVPVPASRDEIGHLAVTLNHMLDRLERGVEEKRRLVADASHELRTPLAVMRSELDVALVYDDLQPDAVRVLASAREEVERMSHTVENLLTLARVDEGRLDLLLRPFDLRDVLDDVAMEIGWIAARKHVSVAVRVDPDAIRVIGDRERIRQVVANFVDNAVKYSPEGGQVKIIGWQEDGEVGVSVVDDGAGIPAKALPRVFDRFYRADGARARESGGSGLGLAICKEIMVAHGGRAWVESRQDGGSRFSLSLASGSAAYN